MQSAPRPQSSNAALRNQLLSTDIGNIDITKETPINKQPNPQYQQQQYQFQPQQNQFSQQQQFNQYQMGQPHMGFQQNQIPPNQRMGPAHSQAPFYPNQPPIRKPQIQHQQQQPRSRRSSIVSNHSSFNPFTKFGKPKKAHRGGGGFDDDDGDDGKDMMDSNDLNSISFDDLTTMNDRGRYGSQSTYDTTPIIPTLASAAERPHGNVSSVQYRKQMTAMKKQAYTNAAKNQMNPNELRAMSLQNGLNPYQGDPRGSVPPPMNYPRANSLATPAFQQFNQSRNNSLQNNMPPQGGPRAQSLTLNSYQQQLQHQQQYRAPMPHGYGQPNGSPKIRPIQNSQPVPPMNQHRLSASGPSPLGNPQRNQYSNVPPPQQQQPVQQPVQQHIQQQKPLQQQTQPHPQPSQLHQYNTQPAQPQQSQRYPSPSYDDDTSHHYLADNTQNDENMDVSSTSFSDVSTSHPKEASVQSFSDITQPKEISTPSPEISKIKEQEKSRDISPSKLTRSKALPHLSLLKMRDDDEDDELNENNNFGSGSNSNYNNRKSQDLSNRASRDYFQRVLEPLDEAKPYTSSTPPLSGDISPSFSANSSPFKRLNSDNTKNHYKNAVSISSMSEYSTVSDNNDYNDENNQKLYKLADKSSTTNDVFVTASQFSLLGGKGNDSTFRQSSNDEIDYSSNKTPKINNEYEQKTPVIPQESPAGTKSQNRVSSGTFKDVLKSPKFFKKWSKKKSVDNTELDLVVPSNTFRSPVSPEENNLNRNAVPSHTFKSPVSPEDNLNRNVVPSNAFRSPVSPEESYLDRNATITTNHTNNTNTTATNDNTLTSSPATITAAPIEKKDSSFEAKALGDSFVPQQKAKSLNLTVDQLGIMESKTVLIRELDLVSKELASSIKRELILEEKLQGNAISPINDNFEEQLRNSALEISRLTQLLNEERKKRYIAEEHVLLQENGVKPSPLELNYENENLKSELSIKEELINKQTSEITSLKEELPVINSKLSQLTKDYADLEVANLELKNEVEVLRDDRTKLVILAQKFKILKVERDQLEKEVASKEKYLKANNSSTDILSPPSNQKKIPKQRAFLNEPSPNNSFESIRQTSPFHTKRLTSFSLINVSSSADD